ncbi:MAG: heparinase II/III family protein [Armatimonadota bacterium]|nr:heparinase II/III family protein [Armatimonadota bacterium]MCX7777876.1 heparinase II/III family protein [Armatimonadota bacterium]MDW8025960.1 heparinase II/III family protein [Armatimonadota bacterium]
MAQWLSIMWLTVALTTGVNIPSPEEWSKLVKKVHPRLLVPSNDFEGVRRLTGTNTTVAKLYSSVRQQAMRILNEPPSRYEIPDGLRLLGISRRVLNHIYVLALVYRIDGDKRCVERAWHEIEAAANFPDWNPRHFLDTAEMTHAFAIAYDWLYDQWSEEQRRIIVDAIVSKGLERALEVYRNRGWWTRARHNWNQVCNGGIGMGALAIFEEQPKLCGEILTSALNSLLLPMGEFSPDGAWAEGPSYWNYATSYNCAFLAALETAVGTDFGLSNMEGFSETGLFPIYITGPLGRTFNFADGGDGTLRSPHMFWLARKFNKPVYAWYARTTASPHPLDIIWFDETGGDPQAEGLPLDKHFRQVEVVTMRTAWNDRNATFVAFKAGDNRANHSNLDIGTFVIDALGYRWALDLGADDYNLPGYFGVLRWSYYRMRAEGHNTLVINPSKEPDQDPGAFARVVRFVSRKDAAFAIADLTPAYSAHALSVRRGVKLVREAGRNAVVIQDEVELKSLGDVYWFMHTPAQVQIDGATAILRQGDAVLLCRILSPADAQFTLMEAKPLPSSPDPKGQNPNAGVRKLAIRFSGIKELHCCVILIPLRKSQEPPKDMPSVEALNKWQ